MTRPLCTVAFATYQRGHLLARSVECYNRSRFPLGRLEVVVVDDGSTDDTAAVCERFDPRIRVVYLRLRKPAGLWRDCAAVLNHGLRAAAGSVVLLTHPEVMPGRDTLQACCDAARPGVYACAKPYYLSPRDQTLIDTVGWREQGVLAVRDIPGFYDLDQPTPCNEDYRPRAIEAAPVWESWVFGGHDRATWKRLGGLVETTAWGSVDLLWLQRRHLLGLANATVQGDDTLCCHQNHDAPATNVVTPRDMDLCHRQAADAGLTAETAAFPAVDHLW